MASFDRLKLHARALGAEEALLLLRQQLDRHGNDATWLRRLHARERMLPEVVRQQVRCWSGESSGPADLVDA